MTPQIKATSTMKPSLLSTMGLMRRSIRGWSTSLLYDRNLLQPKVFFESGLKGLGVNEISAEHCRKLVGIGTDGASANIAAAGLALVWMFGCGVWHIGWS